MPALNLIHRLRGYSQPSNSKLSVLAVIAAFASAATPLQVQADEGMWLYNAPPRELVRQRYGFELTDAWLSHAQHASVRFNTGGSGEFVSEDGLVLSNHHVGSDSLNRLSTREHNYLRDGFYAATRDQEKVCPGLELNVLMEIEDVTSRVNEALKPGMSDEVAFKARRAVIAAIEKESFEKTGLRSDVITLWQGAQYHLYRFKKYTDVRLVFAPEEQIAFYGGDPDNFEYPRYDLDICFFRVYENGRPARVADYLKWSQAGAGDNELVFVSGHPGRTDRLRTVAELEYLRDFEYPQSLRRLKRLEVLLTAYSARSDENARRARDDLFGYRNGRKARDGTLAGLLDPQLMGAKRAAEEQLKAAVAQKTELKETLASWERIAQGQKVMAARGLEYNLLEREQGFATELFGYARHLLRAAEERPKLNGERLEEYRDSARESFEYALFAEQPIYPDLEILKLADSLTAMAGDLGFGNAAVKQLLGSKSPRELAAEAVRGTKLASPAMRRQLYQGGAKAVADSSDPMLQLARLVDAESRAVRKVFEAEREAVRQAHAQIGKARYAIQGAHGYPDATFTLRLAYGTVKGYQEDGRAIPFETTFAGLYERAASHHNHPPFDLPQRWIDRRRKLKLSTPFNFVSTADIIGGNSGSPVINRAGEFVGIIFDGNIQSLTADLAYSDEQSRAVAVHSSGIVEALQKVYKADALVRELRGK